MSTAGPGPTPNDLNPNTSASPALLEEVRGQDLTSPSEGLSPKVSNIESPSSNSPKSDMDKYFSQEQTDAFNESTPRNRSSSLAE